MRFTGKCCLKLPERREADLPVNNMKRSKADKLCISGVINRLAALTTRKIQCVV